MCISMAWNPSDMHIQIIIPPGAGERSGNRRTAAQWARVLEALGHQVQVLEQYQEQGLCDLLLALHAGKTHLEQLRFRGVCGEGKLILTLTGTDIYPEPDVAACAAMQGADRLVVLQAGALRQIPESLHGKTRVIVQSARSLAKKPRHSGRFELCVIGHLRPVKDPLLAARAVMELPPDSRVHLSHAGALVETDCPCRVELETLQKSPRYTWLGETDQQATHQLLADSRLMVLSSRFEGGAHVLGESIVEGTPVLATRTDAARALLGEDYPGLFEVGNQAQLTELMRRAETDETFYQSLVDAVAACAGQFHPDRELEAWRALLEDLVPG